MSEIKELMREINSIKKRVANFKNERSTQQSILDRWQDDILHKIENSDKFSLYDAWLLVVELKEVRKLRRKVKNDLLELDVMKNVDSIMQSITTRYNNIINKREKINYKEKINEQTKKTITNAIKGQLPEIEKGDVKN